jgi:hypothetical protein
LFPELPRFADSETQTLDENRQRLIKMLESEPEFASDKALENWKNMEPLTIEEIITKSNTDFDLYAGDLEYKRHDHENIHAVGLFKKGTQTKHGIVRRVYNNGEVYEGMYYNNQLHGYARVLKNNGDQFEGMY